MNRKRNGGASTLPGAAGVEVLVQALIAPVLSRIEGEFQLEVAVNAVGQFLGLEPFVLNPQAQRPRAKPDPETTVRAVTAYIIFRLLTKEEGEYIDAGEIRREVVESGAEGLLELLPDYFGEVGWDSLYAQARRPFRQQRARQRAAVTAVDILRRLVKS